MLVRGQEAVNIKIGQIPRINDQCLGNTSETTTNLDDNPSEKEWQKSEYVDLQQCGPLEYKSIG